MRPRWPFGQRSSLGLTLVAAALSLETGLTDATLLMFDKPMGSLSRKAERRSQEKAARAARYLQEKLRVLTGGCTAVIRARETRGDPFVAIEQHMQMGWAVRYGHRARGPCGEYRLS